MSLKQLDSINSPVHGDNLMIDLVVLPFSVREIESRSSLVFSHYDNNDGWYKDVSTVLFCDREMFLLSSEYTKQMKPEVSVQCSIRVSPDSYVDIINGLLSELDITYGSLVWIKPELKKLLKNTLEEEVC